MVAVAHQPVLNPASAERQGRLRVRLAYGRSVRIHTVGHGTLPADDFAALVRTAGIEQVVDVRSYPGSRHNPQFDREAMETWLTECGERYAWQRELGGRRPSRPDSRHTALRNDAFRGYADHMETAAFVTGVQQLLEAAATHETAVMCSESVWWRCHRRLLADHLLLVDGVEVVHLMHDGRRTPHAITDGARRDGDTIVYDVGTTGSLELR
jgi:uncharacterized protein (DUF488 family)